MKCTSVRWIFLCIITIVAVIFLYRVHTSVLDGIDGWVLQLLYRDTTVYASGYNDNAFKSIQNGESVRDVLCKIGEPLKIYAYINGSSQIINMRDAIGAQENQIMIWRYTESSGNYRVRDVYFCGQHVSGKKASFYLD